MSGWAGYAIRYVPLATLAAVVVFALQMLWHVHSVRKLVDFAFVDDRDEPRLCRIVEPLAIGMGLPTPYVGVVESPALNAFACGIRRKDAVVVVTRGLIDGLDDEELAAVVAHELAHIANGDIRLMAAANVCLNMLGQLMRPRMKRTNRLQELAAFPVMAAVVPPVIAFVLIVGFITQSALKVAQLVRFLISSAREFVADAAAVEATQNPAALVSALGKIRGRSRIADMLLGQDAMMIDGAEQGGLATHPSIDQRIKAIVAVTGSMALISPARRDTRAFRRRAPAGTELRRSPVPSGSAAEEERNWFGLTRTMTLGAIPAIAIFLGMNAQNIETPGKLLAALDPRAFNTIVVVAGRGAFCSVATIAPVVDKAYRDEKCALGAMTALIAGQNEHAGIFGPILSAVSEQGGTFRSDGAVLSPAEKSAAATP